ncbi:MAG: TolC family protein [Candidatus Omnitrophota bacterium]
MRNKILFIVFVITIGVFLPVSAVYSLAESEITAYMAALSQGISTAIQSRQFPNTELPAGQYRAVLDINIRADGGIRMIKVVESSGSKSFDQEAKNLMKGLLLYPLPKGRESLNAKIPIEAVVEERGTLDVGRGTGDVGEKELGKITEKVNEKKEKKVVQKKEKLKKIIDMGFMEKKEKIKGIAREAQKLYQIALENSDAAKAAHQQLDLARIKIKNAYRNLFPKMDLQCSFSDGEISTDSYESESYSVQLKQNLFDSGINSKTLRKEKLSLEVEENKYGKIVQDLKSEVIKAYLNVLGKQEELKEAELFQAEALKNYQLAKDLYEIKIITKIEFVEIEAEYKRIANMAEQAGNELKLAKEQLRVSMNLDFGDSVPINQEKLLRIEKVGIDVDECVRLALANKPDVKLWETSLKAAEYAQDIARRESFPRLDLTTSYGYSGEAYSDQNLGLDEEWKIVGAVKWLFGGNTFEVSAKEDKVGYKGVTDSSGSIGSTTYLAKMGVMDNGEYYVKKKQAEISYADDLSNLSKNRQEAILDTRKSFLEYQKSFDEYQVSLFEVKFSNIALELKKEEFKMNKIKLSEVVRLLSNHINKRLSLLKAKTNYYIALADLDKATAYSLGLF